MPKLLSQLNHEEAKMNSGLQCRKQKKENFTSCEFSQTGNLPFPAPLFMLF